MVWIVNLEEVTDGKVVSHTKVMKLDRPARLESLDDLGLRLADGKALLASIQNMIVAKQSERDIQARSVCPRCGARRRIKDYRTRQVDTVFGRVPLRRARFRCVRCHDRHIETVPDRLRGRSTPEFHALRAKLAAHVPYRVARDLICEMLPTSQGVVHTTIRNHTFTAADQIRQCLADEARNTTQPARTMTLGLDTAYIRALPGHPTRHIHVLVGEVLGDDGMQRHFAGIEGSQTPSLIRTNLKRLGYNRQATRLTVLTDGEDALRMFARDATGATITPILDWFHIAMRVQHLKQLARGLSTRVPTHAAATAKIQGELERLHWRLWHGHTDAVDDSIGRLAKSIGAFRRHRAKRRMYESSRQLWVTLYDLKRYVRGNAHTIVNYHRRQRNGQRVSTSTVESAVNRIVDRRMNKSQQMRWSTHGAHQLLQVRAAVINGEFESLVNRPPVDAVGLVNEYLPLAA